MEHDRDAVIKHFATLAPEALDSLTPEERHKLYKMLRLGVWVSKSGDLEIEMAGVPVGVEDLGRFLPVRSAIRDVHLKMVERPSCASAPY